jgi:hypothetical protein
MSGWKQDEWEHEVEMADGSKIHPISIVLGSSTYNKRNEIVPAVFCEILQPSGSIALAWKEWTEVRRVTSTRIPLAPTCG